MSDAPVFRSTYVPPPDPAPERPTTNPWFSALILLVFMSIAIGVGLLGSLATGDNVDGWYADADKPPWTPPGVVFGPVWTVLYATMAIAAWLVWLRRHDANVRPALTAYVVQLALNSVWSPVFFALYPTMGVAALWLAFGIIVALIAAVVVTILAFWRVERWAGVILLPYLAWLLFASTLNVGVAVLQS